MGDRDDPGSADETYGRLDADHAVGRGGANHRAVGLGADRGGAQAGRRPRPPEPELEPHGLRVEIVGVVRLPADPAPAAGGALGAEVGPLAQIGLAENDRPSLAQHGDKNASRSVTLPASASDPAVVAIRSRDSMLSLRRTGMPCSGPRTALATLLVECMGLGQGIRVGDDDRVELGIESFNPIEVRCGDRFCAHLALFHHRLEIGNTRLDNGRVFSCPCGRNCQCQKYNKGPGHQCSA